MSRNIQVTGKPLVAPHVVKSENSKVQRQTLRPVSEATQHTTGMKKMIIIHIILFYDIIIIIVYCMTFISYFLILCYVTSFWGGVLPETDLPYGKPRITSIAMENPNLTWAMLLTGV